MIAVISPSEAIHDPECLPEHVRAQLTRALAYSVRVEA